MPKPILALLAAFAVLACGIGEAVAADSPKTLLDGIYAKYVGPRAKAKGVRLDSQAQINALFTPAVAAMILADRKAAAARKEVPNLDGDPFVDAQDYEITGVQVVVTLTDGDKSRATAVAMFKNFGKPVSVDYVLLKTKAGWRIDDIKWPEGSLRAVLKP
ncbi:MAG: DUF3828 domain-containing protein [Bauldia sp.]